MENYDYLYYESENIIHLLTYMCLTVYLKCNSVTWNAVANACHVVGSARINVIWRCKCAAREKKKIWEWCIGLLHSDLKRGAKVRRWVEGCPKYRNIGKWWKLTRKMFGCSIDHKRCLIRCESIVSIYEAYRAGHLSCDSHSVDRMTTNHPTSDINQSRKILPLHCSLCDDAQFDSKEVPAERWCAFTPPAPPPPPPLPDARARVNVCNG